VCVRWERLAQYPRLSDAFLRGAVLALRFSETRLPRGCPRGLHRGFIASTCSSLTEAEERRRGEATRRHGYIAEMIAEMHCRDALPRCIAEILDDTTKGSRPSSTNEVTSISPLKSHLISRLLFMHKRLFLLPSRTSPLKGIRPLPRTSSSLTFFFFK
jgi:hypothetical protein